MDDKRWQHLAVLGAAGKMGSGIALLLLQEIADREGAQLTLLDSNSKGFESLKRYLRDQLIKYAEKNINTLRVQYANRKDLVDNSEIIDAYIINALDRINCVTSPEDCRNVHMVFEAIVEEVDAKVEMFKRIDNASDHKAFFFTNTSSIPISLLQKKSGLDGRLIGFHFYNPPAVQKLLELIVPANIDLQLQQLALDIAAKLKKTVILSNDIAGFIGNGHFIREINGACKKVLELAATMPTTQAIEFINQITQDLMLRPMGIFQLIDYVGIDVCQRIAKIMSQFLGEPFDNSLIDAMVAAHVLGGQNPDGSQKNGFFKYEKGQPIATYDYKITSYVDTDNPSILTLPQGHSPWKALSKDPKRKEKISKYFTLLANDHSKSAEVAKEFLHRSHAIAQQLVSDGIAKSMADVDTVLQQGFFHLYGVEEPFVGNEILRGLT